MRSPLDTRAVLDTSKSSSAARRIATREIAVLVFFLLFGLVALPLAIYFVGDAVFGQYSNGGFGAFYRSFSEKVRYGDWGAWFLMLAPYIGWQIIRLLAFCWRRLAVPASTAP